jgi:hypothetical protein
MGHVRLGRLPKTRRWREVVDLLATSPMDTPAVAQATVEAAEGRLRELANDPSLVHCFWLLTRITWAARSSNFASSLADFGLESSPSAIGFIAQLADVARSHARHHPESGPFSELSSLALRRALTETVGQSSKPLFESSVDDVRDALRPYSNSTQFGALAKRFFGDLLARTLRFFVDREVANNVGGGRPLATLDDSRRFSDALDLYARQSATIMERFGEEWYSKHNWESHGEISQEEAQGFVAHALRKLRSELKQVNP